MSGHALYVPGLLVDGFDKISQRLLQSLDTYYPSPGK